ncbi:metallophosphoesterase family protein [Cysteiniphilum sp. 6C5]
MKRIIHLTDTHLGYENLSSVMRDLVTRIIFTKEKASDYIIVITGDIVEDATKDGAYDEALAQINRLKRAGFHVLVIPGNHDYGTGSIGYSGYVAAFKQAFYGSIDVQYPIKTMIDNIAFLGLDSMAEEIHWYDRLFAEGQLGEAQLQRLDGYLSHDVDIKNAEYRVIYLHHHPFSPRPFHHLKDSDDLGKILKVHKIDMLLFGHNHDGLVWSGKWGIPRVYDGGTSTGKQGKPSPHRVIDLSKHPAFDYDAKF